MHYSQYNNLKRNLKLQGTLSFKYTNSIHNIERIKSDLKEKARFDI